VLLRANHRRVFLYIWASPAWHLPRLPPPRWATLRLARPWHRKTTLIPLPLPPPQLQLNNCNRHRLLSNISSCKHINFSTSLCNNSRSPSSLSNNLLPSNMRSSHPCSSMHRLNPYSNTSAPLLLDRAVPSTRSPASGWTVVSATRPPKHST